MNTDDGRRRSALFARALEVDTAQRGSFLRTACRDDEALFSDVRELLDAHGRMGDFLSESAAGLLADVGAAPALPEPGDRIGEFVLQRLLGRGGGGAVFLAEQEQPRRNVALKFATHGVGTSRTAGQFEAEAEILARLRHRGVAHVYAAGVHRVDGVSLPYFAMEYVEGARTLTRYVEEEGLSIRRRVKLCALVCEAVQHGHEKSILHLDIKPANVLVGARGNPKVIDFGISRTFDGASAAAVTQSGMAGTLPYMSPEQCDPDETDLDVRTDVYGLGVLLYRVLTGTLPHDLGDLPTGEAMRVIREGDSTPPSAHDRRLRGDLDAIVTKAMSRDRAARYPSAAALAEDLWRYLDRQPVTARSGGTAYQIACFFRRKPLACGALAAVVLISVAAAIVSTSLAIESERLAVESERARLEAEFQAYQANITAASAALQIHDPSQARDRLARVPAHRRAWEWRYLWGQLDHSTKTVAWEGRLFGHGAFSPRTGILVAGGGSRGKGPGPRVRVGGWDARTGTCLFDISGVRGDVTAYSVAMSPDGGRFALGYRDGTVELRSPRTGELLHAKRVHEEMVNALAFDATGKLLATGTKDHAVSTWRVPSLEREADFPGHEDRVVSVAFSPDGKHLASGDRLGVVRLIDVATSDARILRPHRDSVEFLAWRPDGRRLVSTSRDRTAHVLEAATGAVVCTLYGHTNNVRSAAYSADGSRIHTASWDRTVRTWDAETGVELCRRRGHTDRVGYIFEDGPHGQLVSLSRDGSFKTWPTTEDPARLVGHGDFVRHVTFSPDSTRLASLSIDKELLVWDTGTRACLPELCPPETVSYSATFGTEGKSLHLGRKGVAVVWSLEDRAYAGRVDLGRAIREFRPDAGLVFTQRVNTVSVQSLRESRRALVWQPHESVTLKLAVNGPGTVLATSAESGEVRLWAGQDGALLASEHVHSSAVHSLAFDSDAGRLAAGSIRGGLAILDGTTLDVSFRLTGHETGVMDVAFSPDGSRLASACYDGTVRIWDLERQITLLVLEQHSGPARCVAWSPDGVYLATGGGEWGRPENSLFLLEGREPASTE